MMKKKIMITDKWELEEIIKNFLQYVVANWDKDGCVKYQDGTKIKYIGLPAISPDLANHIIRKVKLRGILYL